MNDALVTSSAALSNRAPIDFEADVAALPMRGTMPAALNGTLVRNGPNPVVADAHEHWFVGDGMLHAFHIHDGLVDYRNRWVRTAHWQAAMASRSEAQHAQLPVARPEGVANTNIVAHAGRMLALEEAHLPVAMDPATLATLGTEDFDGGMGLRVTAHPKTDPVTGELLFFGYGTPAQLSNGMTFGVVSREGQVRRLESFQAPYASMVHDFAVSANHVVFPITPLTASLDRAQTGRPPYAWEPEHGTRVGIMPRAAGVAAIDWWTGPPCFVFHTVNAWEDGRHLHVDVVQFDKPPLFPLPDGTPAAGGAEPGRLVRWTFDLEDPRRDFAQASLCEIPGEFPRIDERRAGLAHRHVWFAGRVIDDAGKARMQAQLVHLDLGAGAEARPDAYELDAPDRISEPVFVARSPDADEGDGWILATVWRGATNTSDLVVFDARHVAAGPVCVASLPHRVPDGFHGNWFPQGVRA